MKARLLSVIFGLFLVIAAIGQGFYWVTTRSRSDAPWSNDYAHLKGHDVKGHLNNRLLSNNNKGAPKTPSVSSEEPRESIAQTKIDKVERPTLKFKKVRVMGRMASPRVDFTQGALPVERVDEPMRQEFFQKVFLPVGDYSF